MEIVQVITLVVVLFLIISLYREWFNPALTFFISAMALLVTNVITPQDLLRGLSNQQIIIIFLLVLVTAGIRVVFGSAFFSKLFSYELSPRAFLLRLMVFSSSVSAFLNNTPIVAFMIPYVKDWAEKTGNSSSRLLIPLSFATILGGMITVIGTSTNLVLNGLISEYHLPLLGFTDFVYLGVAVTLAGWLYFYFIGYHLLPVNQEKIDAVRQNLKEYIVETVVFKGSPLVGKTVREAGLRQLQDLFLVEILRDNEIISPVSPEERLAEGDLLFFSGHTESIYRLIREDNGLMVPRQENLERQGQFNFIEAVIPSGSDLTGVRIKDSDFRSRFNASIVAIHRHGKRVSGKVGEMHLAGGDFLLLLAGDQFIHRSGDKDIVILSVPQRIKAEKPTWYPWFGVAAFLVLLLGITGLLPLFTCCLLVLTSMIFFKILTITEIKKNLDLSLLVVLVCSLAIGVALQKSQTAEWIARGLISSSQSFGPMGVLTSLFLLTIFLTSLITNAAAVSIMFPIAMSMAQTLGIPTTPFFVAIAFAASGDFMTPIGYQTNLMVYGPGGYTFLDFVKVGAPLTLIYTLICLLFISFYYPI
jgi:di/tricarboxylate transporter